MIKTILIAVLAIILTGCQLDNVVRMQSGSGSLATPFSNPEVEGCSLQTQGNITYQFLAVYEDETCIIEVSNDEW